MESFSPASPICPYAWYSSLDDPGSLRRALWGAEKVEGAQYLNNRENYIFFGADLVVTKPVSTSHLLDRARDAWVALRFSTPIIASRAGHDDAHNVFLSYQLAKSQEDAYTWATQTVQFVSEYNDLDELRCDIAERQMQNAKGCQAHLYFISRSETSFSILLVASHVQFDGTGLKIILKRYLTLLGRFIHDPPHIFVSQLAWGSEGKNLTPAVPEVLSQNEITHGPEYDATIESIVSNVIKAARHQYGFKHQDFGSGPIRRQSHTFTVEETTNLVQYARCQGFTVNHLLHAALMLVCAYDNAPGKSTPPDACFTPLVLFNCRNRLNDEYSGSNGYPGLCMSGLPIVVPLSIFMTSAHKEPKEQLLDMTSAVKLAYVKAKAYPSLLSTSDVLNDSFVKHLNENGFPTFNATPFLLGDGVDETYLDPVYSDIRGDEMIQIKNSFLWGKTDGPELHFRASTWRGRLRLATNYSDYSTTGDEIQVWMNKWVEVLRLVL